MTCTELEALVPLLRCAARRAVGWLRYLAPEAQARLLRNMSGLYDQAARAASSL